MKLRLVAAVTLPVLLAAGLFAQTPPAEGVPPGARSPKSLINPPDRKSQLTASHGPGTTADIPRQLR